MANKRYATDQDWNNLEDNDGWVKNFRYLRRYIMDLHKRVEDLEREVHSFVPIGRDGKIE